MKITNLLRPAITNKPTGSLVHLPGCRGLPWASYLVADSCRWLAECFMKVHVTSTLKQLLQLWDNQVNLYNLSLTQVNLYNLSLTQCTSIEAHSSCCPLHLSSTTWRRESLILYKPSAILKPGLQPPQAVWVVWATGSLLDLAMIPTVWQSVMTEDRCTRPGCESDLSVNTLIVGAGWHFYGTFSHYAKEQPPQN